MDITDNAGFVSSTESSVTRSSRRILRQPLTFWGLYNPTAIERLTLFGPGYSAPKNKFHE